MSTRALLLPLLLLASALPARAQETPPPADPEAQTPAFEGRVEQVTVDVVVLDKDGAPVRGLGPADLEIYEDGAKQKVVSFEAVDVPETPQATPPSRPLVSTNQDPGNDRGRTFVLLFDDTHLTATTARLAKAAIADFLQRGVREGDQVTLVSASGDTWWTSRMEAGREELLGLLKRLDGRYVPDTSRERITDYEALRIHMMRDVDVAFRVQRRFEEFGVALPLSSSEPEQARYWATSIDPHLAQQAATVYMDSVPRNQVTLMGLARAIEALNATKGRKSLILISDGFIYDPNLSKEYERVLRAARRANTVVYFVDAKGLQGMPTFMTAQFGPPLPEQDLGFVFSEDLEISEGAYSLASRSGGFSIRDTNDLAAGLERIADENASYYLVGYNPTNTARDGKFRKIEVEVPGRRGVDVRARQGYYAPDASGDDSIYERGVDAVFQEALDSPAEMDDIPLRMTAYVGGSITPGSAVVRVVTEVDVSALTFEQQEGRYVGGVEFVLVAAHRDTGEYSRYDQKVEMKLLPETREKLLKTGFPIVREFELPPGGHRAKIAVRDVNSDRVGTVIHEFEVPELDGFRVSTPVLSDTRQEGGERAGEPAPVAHRSFDPGSPLYCLVEVYGAQKDDAGMPQVVMGYAIRNEAGGAVAFAEPTLIRPTSIGHVARMIQVGLDRTPPGRYELVMAFRDMLSGKYLELSEPFSVAGGAQAKASAGGE